jgi:hypothetical protein
MTATMRTMRRPIFAVIRFAPSRDLGAIGWTMQNKLGRFKCAGDSISLRTR